jgi:DHA1 family multidrug resistance protein-like MFS transporter
MVGDNAPAGDPAHRIESNHGMSTTSEPSQRQRQQGLWALYVTTLFSWGGYFLVVPLLAVHYVDDLGWAAATVGILLAVRQFTQQTVGVVFGVICDRIGPRTPILAGMAFRSAGFVSLAYADTFWLMMGSMILAALGGAMFDSPKSAAIAYLAPPDERPRIYSILGVLGGIGVALGTQLGALLIQADFRLVCFAGAAVYLVIALVIITWLPPMRVSGEVSATSPLGGIGLALRDSTFVRFLVMTSGYWFVWTQFSLTVTLAATDIAGTPAAVSWIYLINTGVTVGLGFLLPTFLARWLRPIGLLLWGMVILSVGIALVGFATGTPTILLAALVFSIGVVLARPGQETVTANLADPAARGTYFGVAYFSMAIGGGLGNLVGGLAYDYGEANDLAHAPWILFGLVGMVSAVGLWIYRREFGVVRGTEVVAVEGADDLSTTRLPAGVRS